MPSQYTSSLGIEKIGSGEQAGTWGTTTNLNFDIIDRGINGAKSIAISGTTTTVTTTDGALSDGGHKFLTFTGALGAENIITIDPNDQEKIYIIRNNTTDSGSSGPYSIKIRQQTTGSPDTAKDVTVSNGSFKIVHCDGLGLNATVTDITSNFELSSLRLAGTTITSTAAELNLMDGGTSATSTTIVDADRLIVNDDGTMVQAAVTDLSTYINSNLVEVKSVQTISGALDVVATKATSVYQQVIVSSSTQQINVQTNNLVAGQYVIIDKKTSANKMTINWNAGDGSTALSGGNVSTGLSLGDSVDFALGIFNGTNFSFTETIKF